MYHFLQKYVLMCGCILCPFLHAIELQKPRVSIITSVFDPQNLFIREFLEDITRQTIFDQCELLLIHPPSGGNEEAVIREYLSQYPNIRYIKLDRDPGIYGVWNVGVQRAQADFVTNANLDDRRNPQCLEMHAKALEEDTTIGLVYSNCLMTKKQHEIYEKNSAHTVLNPPGFSPSIMYMCLPGPMPMWRKAIHGECGLFREDFFIAGDLEMWNRMASHGICFKKIPGISGIFYLNPQGLSCDATNAQGERLDGLSKKEVKSKRAQQLEDENRLIAEWYQKLWRGKKFTLIINLYNEKSEARRQEYIICLEKNLAHACIDKIHVIYDTANDDSENKLLQYLLTKNITISAYQGRATYKYCFELANQLFPFKRIILSNADIYFNETLDMLSDYDLTNKFVSLTRWNVKNDDSLEIFKQYDRAGNFQKLWSEASQDVWIFETPLRRFSYADIQMGTMQCDSQIAYQAHMSGLHVINPCLSIQCCHLHNSNIRNYDPAVPQGKPWMPVAWQELRI